MNSCERVRATCAPFAKSQICEPSAACRIKIQWIEFLCDMRRRTGNLSPPVALKLNLRFNFNATAEDSKLVPPVALKLNLRFNFNARARRFVSPQPYGWGLTNLRPSRSEGGEFSHKNSIHWILSHKNSINWIFMRELADFESSAARRRAHKSATLCERLDPEVAATFASRRLAPEVADLRARSLLAEGSKSASSRYLIKSLI